MKSRPIDEPEKMSRKFCTPMNRAVSKPVCVDHAWNDSQTVSSVGTRTKTVISPVAGASIGNVDCVCLRRITETSDEDEGGTEVPTLGGIVYCAARVKISVASDCAVFC